MGQKRWSSRRRDRDEAESRPAEALARKGLGGSWPVRTKDAHLSNQPTALPRRCPVKGAASQQLNIPTSRMESDHSRNCLMKWKRQPCFGISALSP
jgi:hypothetical protein